MGENLQVPGNAAFFFALCALATSLPSRSEPSMLGFVTEPMKKGSWAMKGLPAAGGDGAIRRSENVSL